MLSELRCVCGCRMFINRQVIVTTASGTIRDVPSVMILECVSCVTVYSVGTEAGKKTLTPLDSGTEKLLFEAALKDWANKDRPDSNANHIVLDPADEQDFARLGVAR